MTLNAQWCSRLIDQATETAWRSGQITRTLSRELDDARIAWDDSAGHRIFARALDPNREALQSTSVSLATQISHLSDALKMMGECAAAILRVGHLTDQILELTDQVRIDLEESHDDIDRALNMAAEVEGLVAQCQQILSEI